MSPEPTDAGGAAETAELRLQQLRLENRKLAAEIADLERPHRSSLPDRLKGWTALLIAVLTIGGSAFGLYKGVDGYLDQRRREYEFTVNKEIIQLTSQLGSHKPIERTNAALLLAGFEKDAVPILVTNLRDTDHPGTAHDVVHALGLVLEKEKYADRPEVVLDPLLEQTVEAFRDGLARPDAGIDGMMNYLRALNVLAAGRPNDRVVATLDSLKARINAPGSRIEGVPRDALNAMLDHTRASLRPPG
jgi:hypothetical protein